MFKSLDSIASVVGMFMYLTISKFKQVLRSRKGLGKVSTTTLVHVHVLLLNLLTLTETMFTSTIPYYMYMKRFIQSNMSLYNTFSFLKVH